MSTARKGERIKGHRIEVRIRVDGQLKTKTFAVDTPEAERDAWREAQRLGPAQRGPLASGSLGAEIARYVTASAIGTIAQRAAHLELWARALGHGRHASTVTAHQIDAVLNGWLKADLAPGTVRKRRQALASFYVWRNGKHGANPVRGTVNPRPPQPEARGIDYELIERMLDAMPTYRDSKPGAPRVLALGTVRAAVIAYTGLPPKTLQAITPADLDFKAGTVRVMPRKKGRGVEARVLPLTPQGLSAFRAFHAAHAYGRFAVESLNRAIKRAFKRIDVDPASVHLYDLRHSFLTELYRTTRDQATVARFGLHAEGSPITAIYTRAAHEEVDKAAAAAFGQRHTDRRRAQLKPVASGGA